MVICVICTWVSRNNSGKTKIGLAFFEEPCYNTPAHGSRWVLVCPAVFKTVEGG